MNLPLEVFKLVSDRLEGDGAFSRQSTVRVQIIQYDTVNYMVERSVPVAGSNRMINLE